ncbi:hypothetical protein MSG28_004896 [Choristoneura fumiferana]|uniref:Uncharacterized protein n=1 Tax=Choristoneura fumiferana TaxID=7141 RepID=A0ACC0JNY1_CHOFU|nr:hypothetical protein MSG28_004896 [Choristoneura fumiferana]
MLLLLSCLVILPSARAFIDCSMACKQCRDELQDYHMREVYCAMCRECRERRRERRAMQQELRDRDYGWEPQEQQEPPPGCPTPPDCTDTSSEILNGDITPTEATTCMPVTTARTCPPIIPCRDRKKMTEKHSPTTTPSTTPLPPVTPAYMPCVPCMSMCPCPANQQVVASPLVAPSTMPPTTAQDFFYLYIGFPKGALNKTDE